jgi:hypothetical protein
MKRLKLLVLMLVLIAGYSCKETKKEKKEVDQEMVSEKFSLVKDSTKVSFTAYKTSEKLPVGGKFMKIDITNANEGAGPLEALNGSTFSIPVSSLFTNDATGTRDPKILEFFFGVMTNTIQINGKFKVSADTKCSIDVTLNGKTSNIPLEYVMDSENSITFNGTMNLEDWNALDAIASINEACKELHTGKDGISKTWNEVAVQAQVLLQKE